MKAQWLQLLGTPSVPDSEWRSEPDQLVRVSELDGPDYRAEMFTQRSGPGGQRQKVIVLHPHRPAGSPTPCAIVPFYQPERTAGLMPDAFEQPPQWSPHDPSEEVIRMGQHLARMGLVVVCVEAYAFNTVPDPGGVPPGRVNLNLWADAGAKIRADHPQWTGLGKLVADTKRALDLLLAQPGVDPQRVLCMGHSLGGKMTFYTSALDDRITCAIASDFGLPWRSTNWTDIWYLDPERVAQAEQCGMAHHQLLALLAPRPFLILAGEADGAEAWQYLEAARPVYDLDHAGERLGCIHHAAGHRPPLCALDLAYAWLGEQFQLPHRLWRTETA